MRNKLIGKSEAVLQINRTIERISQLKNPVLLTGETGTGKTVIASLIHDSSERSQSSFVVFDSFSVPKPHIESRLFGRSESDGTVTKGLVSQADKKTLLIKNVELLPEDAQSNLMSIISSNEYYVEGISEPVGVDVKLICTSKSSIDQLSEERKIDLTLLNVLSEFHIHVPPLRERLEDIPELVGYFLVNASRELSIPTPVMNIEFLERILLERLPGNASQLENMIKTSLAMSKKGELEVDNLPDRVLKTKPDYLNSLMTKLKTVAGRKYKKFINNIEEELLITALAEMKYNQVKVADLFGIDESTLRRKMDKYGIPRKRSRRSHF